MDDLPERMFSEQEIRTIIENLDNSQRRLLTDVIEMVVACFECRTHHMVIHFVHDEEDLKTFSLNCDFEETAFIANQASEGLMAVIKDMEKSRGTAH